MKYAIATTEEEAISLQSDEDSAAGLPRCECAACGGVEIGGGVHAPHGVPMTVHLNAIKSKPDGTAWAFPVADETVETEAPIEAEQPIGKGGAVTMGKAESVTMVEALDETWEAVAEVM